MSFKNHWGRKGWEGTEKLKIYILHSLNLLEKGP